MIEAVSPVRLPLALRSPLAASQVAAGLWHLISMACQLKANVPTCLPLCVALLQSVTGLSYCLLTEPKATGHLHLRGGAGSASVDTDTGVWTSVRCVWRWGEEKESADQSAAQSICYLTNEEYRRGEWEERWRRREKMIKRSCGFLSGYNGSPPSSILSKHDWARSR